MKFKTLAVTVSILVVALAAPLNAASLSGKKVLYVDSYHEGYPWSDQITGGIQTVLKDSGVDLKIFRMDTKRNKDKEFKEEAALKAKAVIESFKPDVVITSDDNAVKYLIKPYFKDSSIPFVFCGVNWDASVYGLPYTNTTGMVEVGLATQLAENLSQYAKGSRLGYLTDTAETSMKTARNYKDILNLDFEKEYFVSSMDEWKQMYLKLQDEVDMLIIGNFAGIEDWNENEAIKVAKSSTKVPTGATFSSRMPFSMIGMSKSAEEQGMWSAKAALRILNGTKPTSIKIVKNKKAELYLNVDLASAAGITFKTALVKNATIIR